MIKLLLFKESFIEIEYDSILMITCRFTKYKYFISYLKISTAEDLAYIFLKFIHSNYRLLKKIISNKNKLFILRFWKLLINQLEIKYKFSTVYYSQINKQTERLNQTME